MKKITDIKPQAKTPTRCNIYLDNSFYCGLELETVMKFRLKVGQEIEPERLDEIQLDSEKIKALDKALTFISKSKKTKKQVKDYLYKKGYTVQTVDAVILKMEDYRFIADDDYAEGYVKTYSKSKGKRLLKMELKQKGVSEEDMASALSLVEDESENALAVAQKYNIEPKRLQFIYPKHNKKSNLIMIDGRKNGNTGLTVLNPLFVHKEDGSYTEEVLKMFGK